MKTAATLTFISEAKTTVKGNVLKQLGQEWPLTSRQIYLKLRENRSEVSYQAVHKSLTQLVLQNIVIRERNLFSLNPEWLEEAKGILSEFHYNYSDQKKLGIDSEPVGRLLSISTNTLSLLSRLLLEKNLRLEKDAWFLYGNRVTITPVPGLVEFSRICRGKNEAHIPYLGGKKGGYEWTKKLIRAGKFRHDDVSGLTMHAGDMFAFAGWSSLFVKELLPHKKRITLVLENSAEANEYLRLFGKSTLPVCDFSRGLFAGGYAPPFHEPTLEFIEVHCKATGHKSCEIVGGPRRYFDLKRKEVSRQLGKTPQKLDLAFF